MHLAPIIIVFVTFMAICGADKRTGAPALRLLASGRLVGYVLFVDLTNVCLLSYCLVKVIWSTVCKILVRNHCSRCRFVVGVHVIQTLNAHTAFLWS